MKKNNYSAKTKWQAVLDFLQGKDRVRIARNYAIHPRSLDNWKKTALERGPELFQANTTHKKQNRRISDLEQLLGKKEVEIALLKNWLG
jgi:transposase